VNLDTATLANIAIAASAVVALVFGIFQVLAAVRDRRERLTIEIVRTLQTREFAELAMDLRNHPPPTSGREWLALPEAARLTHVQFLQSMEMLGLLVYDGTIDLQLVERTLGSYVVTTWQKFRPSIMDLRKFYPDPYLSEYYQYLAERIEALMQQHPREPAYKPAH